MANILILIQSIYLENTCPSEIMAGTHVTIALVETHLQYTTKQMGSGQTGT